MIKIENLSKSFGAKKILEGLSFNIQQGESMVIMGGSGCGKSVLIKCIIGLLDPEPNSKIFINGEQTFGHKNQDRKSLISKFGVLFQGGALFDSLTVWQNICFALINAKSVTKKEAMDLAREKLALVGLGEEVANQFPVELSGGMQKRVALARAIALDPKIIFFDEPTAGLDPIMSGLISELIRKCSKELGATIITITHDMHCAEIVADKAALLYKGGFVWHGNGNEIRKANNEYLIQFVNGLTQGPFELNYKAVQ